MFCVFSREKIYTYFVSVVMVFLLFFVANGLNVFLDNTVQVVTDINCRGPIYSVQTNDEKVALTINCDLGDNNIGGILRFFEKYDVSLNFFVSYDWIDKNLEILKRMDNKFYEVGILYVIDENDESIDYSQVLKQLELCNDKIESVIGKRVCKCRFVNKCNNSKDVFNDENKLLFSKVINGGYEIVQWNREILGDYNVDMLNFKSGDIVLISGKNANSSDFLVDIIDVLRARRFNVVVLSELVYDRNFYVTDQGVQMLN